MNSINVCSKFKFYGTSFSVNKIIKGERLFWKSEDLFWFLTLTSFENALCAVKLTIEIVSIL